MKTAVGTPTYAAPEVLQAEEVEYGPQVDMWSFGVMIYMLLCGYPPFYDRDMKKLYKKILLCEYEFTSPAWDNISAGARPCVGGGGLPFAPNGRPRAALPPPRRGEGLCGEPARAGSRCPDEAERSTHAPLDRAANTGRLASRPRRISPALSASADTCSRHDPLDPAEALGATIALGEGTWGHSLPPSKAAGVRHVCPGVCRVG